MNLIKIFIIPILIVFGIPLVWIIFIVGIIILGVLYALAYPIVIMFKLIKKIFNKLFTSNIHD